MANVSYPGVYIEEVSSGVRAISTAGTSTAAFLGRAARGSLSEATRVYNFTEYQNQFGGFLEDSYLSHAVYQFFQNGGTQCYIVRVAGSGAETANIVLKNRGGSSAAVLTISAISPGVWGNDLAVVITDGSRDPENEMNLIVYVQGSAAPLERFENLSMQPDSPNFVERVVRSKYITLLVDQSNPHAGRGVSRSGAIASLTGLDAKKKLRININGDGVRDITLSGTESAIDEVATTIQTAVRALSPLRASTPGAAYSGFTCAAESGQLVLTSGEASSASSVVVLAAAATAEDATSILKLGRHNGAVEINGSAALRPVANNSIDHAYLVGDHGSDPAVASTVAGADGAALVPQNYIDALRRLDNIDDVSLIAVPGVGAPEVVGAGLAYCENRPLSDCFFIGDMDQADDSTTAAKQFTDRVSPKNSYGAVYTPWIRVLDPTGKSGPILVPPSGFVAGLYAKTDNRRGVWKAPAGTAAGLSGVVGLARNFTDLEQGELNPKNINVVRQFSGSGTVLWGARTLSSDPEYGYVPVRRMGILIRVSIFRGIQWAVFEPNDEDLWRQLRLNIDSFMTGLYRRGAFQGSTPSQAFFVKCDAETTTQADIDLGIVNVLVGFAPLKPAEFVVVRVSQMAGKT